MYFKPSLHTFCSPVQILLTYKPVSTYLLLSSWKTFPVMELSKPLLANSGLKAIPALGELMLPSCGLRPSPGFIQVHLMLRWWSPVWLCHLVTASPPPQLMSLFPETATREWRFCFAESVPVSVNGSNLETQVMANPSGICCGSRLCLPLPYLRYKDTFSASSMVSQHVLCLSLPSPPWAYWDPASHEKPVAWYLMT
jgi:hypothetical protein